MQLRYVFCYKAVFGPQTLLQKHNR